MRTLTLSAAALAIVALSAAPVLADPPAVGKPGPAFSLKNQDEKIVTNEDLKGKWSILFFYPADFTFV